MSDRERSSSIQPPPVELRHFLDSEGRLRQWPGKLKKQLAAYAWLATLFEFGREYSEKEVSEVLRTAHTFEDWAILRRGLCDHRYLEREADGSRYRRVVRPEP
jgi:hypothetical protein